jgi:hypothetical protein
MRRARIGTDSVTGSAVHRLHVEHFIGWAEAVALVKRLAGIRRMERHHTDFLPASLGKCLVDQLTGQPLAAVLRFDVDIQQVAALILARVQRVRRPVENHQAGAGDHLPAFGGKPAQVPAVRQPLFHP